MLPTKVDKAVAALGAGAGAVNGSPVPMFVGLNVPLVSGVPILLLAASSRRIVRLVTAVPPPTSERIIRFCPPGPTKSMSTSSGVGWEKPLI